MAAKFTFRKKDGTASQPVGLPKLMEAARNRIVAGDGGFRLTQDGDKILDGALRIVTLDKLEKRLANGDIGPVYRVFNKKDELVFQCREVKLAVEVINTSGNKKVDVFWTDLKAQFPGITFLGAYVCKNVSGSSTRSQHSYGNAVDPGASGDLLNRIARWSIDRAGKYCIRNVIWDDHIWSAGSGTRPYTGDRHVSHMHVDFNPQCSGSCGVRETGPC